MFPHYTLYHLMAKPCRTYTVTTPQDPYPSTLREKQTGDAALGLRTKRSIPLKRTCDVDASILSGRTQTLIHHALFLGLMYIPKCAFKHEKKIMLKADP